MISMAFWIVGCVADRFGCPRGTQEGGGCLGNGVEMGSACSTLPGELRFAESAIVGVNFRGRWRSEQATHDVFRDP